MNGEDIIESIYEKELQSTNQQIFRIEKIIKRALNYMSNEKGTMIRSMVGLTKKIPYKNE